MSEKRFHIERDSTGTFTFFYDGKHRLYDEEVVNLLNEQSVEIQKLTKERNRYKGQIKQKNDKIERLQRENNKLQVHYKYDVKQLQEEIVFWKKWVLEYLINYDIYTDEFLETLESIEGEETVEKIRERQNEIIKILKQEGLL